MKTNQELLDFYGVELNQIYKIEGDCEKFFKVILSACSKIPRVIISYNPENITEGYYNEFAGLGLDYLNDIKYEKYNPILDEKEKEYLSAVIKPFKERIDYIKKMTYEDKYEYISIMIKNDVSIVFPNFNKNKMYKGMKLCKHYTLEELDL